MKILLAFCLLINCAFINISNDTPKDRIFSYIENYKEIAVIEMHRSNIPASIILAQGLHESNYGASDLATKANNHFGIKCKSYWRGQTYYHKDDDYDKSGRLLESCFRKYNTSLESYVDHSNFLMQTSHYQKLFEFDRFDYESWAHGLKACGYATDPNYAKKLINLIEKYKLTQYDYWEVPFRTIVD